MKWLIRFVCGPWRSSDFDLPAGVHYEFPYFYSDPAHFVPQAGEAECV